MSNDEILREFILETEENLSLLDSDLVRLELNPDEKSTLAQVFRTFHSVKGTAGFMGLIKLQAIAHSAENLLVRIRAGEVQFNPTVASVLLATVDAIRHVLANIESSGNEGNDEYGTVIGAIDRLRASHHHESQRASSDDEQAQATILLPVADVEPPQGASGPITEMPPTLGTESTVTMSASPTVHHSVQRASNAATDNAADVEGSGELRSSAVTDSAIRVDVGLLDQLMTLVGELVLARNQIIQYCDSQKDGGLRDAVQRLNQLTTDLQANVMKTRMQPIGNVLSKFPRVVRDLSLACGKKVRFEMEGEETELDKTLVEAIRDPLTHLIRNAVDHGIELPSVRSSRGKQEEGRLRVVAFHEGGKVIVEISDDGAGIDVERVRAKAISANLIKPDIAHTLSPKELKRLIFSPGFSTADRVTQFSGRGVGMDVVRTNIEKIGGSVDIESTLGAGTTIRTKIPLTLAIIPALIITCSGERFAIPQVNLLELVCFSPEADKLGIEWMHGTPLYRLRGELLPLVFLNEQLGLNGSGHNQSEFNIVVLSANERSFGLVVDAICDTQEIVVKPLQNLIKGVPTFAGASIMGDGRVALVLDVLSLAHRASVDAASQRLAVGEVLNQPQRHACEEGDQLLIFRATDGGLMAIPLAQVARLEEFPRTRVKSLGGRQVVGYGEDILPLFDVSRELNRLSNGNDAAAIDRTTVQEELSDIATVVVLAGPSDRLGLIVDSILDIVVDPGATRFRPNRAGVMFTLIINERIVEFIDVGALVSQPDMQLPDHSIQRSIGNGAPLCRNNSSAHST